LINGFMSKYYNPHRTRNIYDSALNSAQGGQAPSSEPFKLSRSRIEQFLKCPRCFYIDRRLGVDKYNKSR